MRSPSLVAPLGRHLLPLHIFDLLQQAPRHGLDLQAAIEGLSRGAWRPSPGTLYPTLQKMESDGLVQGAWERSRAAPRRVYRLTPAGRVARLSLRRRLREELRVARDLLDAQLAALAPASPSRAARSRDQSDASSADGP